MRKIVYGILICALLLALTACSAGTATIESDKDLTRSYTLAELERFIKHRNGETLIFLGNETQDLLFYPELNEKFPVEVIKRRDDTTLDLAYTVYRVSEGGYYYVFWGHATPVSENTAESPDPFMDTDPKHMYVCFSAYYGPYMKKSDFKSLEIGVSTAEDVKKIDPNFEYDPMTIGGRKSYSLIGNDKVLEIKYTLTEAEEAPYDYSSLIVKEINVVPIENTYSHFNVVFDGDMP